MAKVQEVAAPALAQVEAIDPLSLAKPMAAPTVNTAPIFSAGHQCVIDQSQPGRFSLHVPATKEAFGNLWSTPNKAHNGKAGKAPAQYLAKTDGQFGATTVDIGGKRCYVKLTIQVAED